jgi:hypothetical protein
MKKKIPRIKKWFLSSHAALRAEEREISAHEIQELLLKPDYIIEQGSKWIFAKEFLSRQDNLIAAVILEKQEKDLWLVITIMTEFEIKK